MSADTAVIQQLILSYDSTLYNIKKMIYKRGNTAELTQIILIKKLQDKLAKKIQ